MAIRLSQEYELAVWKKSFLQQSRFDLCNCRVCKRPFAVQIDYAICTAIKHNGDVRAEHLAKALKPGVQTSEVLLPSTVLI